MYNIIKIRDYQIKKNIIYIFIFFYFFVLKFSLANQNFNTQNFNNQNFNNQNLSIPEYVLSFKYYDYNLKSNIEYFLFDDVQQVVDYDNNKIYFFGIDKNVFTILNELYNLKGKEFPIYYYPPIPKEKLTNKKLKNNPTSFGIIAYLKKYYNSDLEIMYLYDYSTPNFYKYIDPNLASILYPIEDNLKILVNQIMLLRLNYNEKNIEIKDYKDHLNYLKAFNNLSNSDISLYEAYFRNDYFYFKFLDSKNNSLKVFIIDKYKSYKNLGNYYLKNFESFKF